MTNSLYVTTFSQRILIIGTGCVAQGFLPLLLRHINLHPEQITILSPESNGNQLAISYGITFLKCKLTENNYSNVLSKKLTKGDCLINLALGVSSLDLLIWCQKQDVIYLDTNLEPWINKTHYLYAARAVALKYHRPGSCTALIAHGANPGLVSHFLKQALCELASKHTISIPTTPEREWWAMLSNELRIRVIQVAEYDSQISSIPKAKNEFANTWSAQGLANELSSSAEVGWGFHETHIPEATHNIETSTGHVIVSEQSAGSFKVQTWTPGGGELNGYLIGHYEAISINELLTPIGSNHGPTVFYAYQPCPHAQTSAKELQKRGWVTQSKMRVMKNELIDGGNELGVLLLGVNAGYWFGSRLSLAQARELAPNNNATSLQVAAGLLGGLVWAIENPNKGVVEAEDIDFRRVLAVASPYLGLLGGVTTAWRPVSDTLHEAALQFNHFLVE